MALNKTALTDGLRALFTAPPSSFTGCADQWASSVYEYSKAVLPISTTAAVARDTLATALAAVFTTSIEPATTANGMEAAFTTYATTLAVGMLPTYTGIQPAGSIGFLDIFLAGAAVDADAAVVTFGDAISNWFLTGTAILVAPPNTTITWT